MLNRIFIQNFALIDSLDISLDKGLQVITGETGAGKSIILGALRLILGERADLKAIADAGKKSVVEAEFTVPQQVQGFFEEHDLDFETPTIIRREILPAGKSRAFVNDVPVTLEVLKNLSANLVDIHSQFETSNLFSEDYHFKIIDGLSKNKTLIAGYQSEFYKVKSIEKNLQSLKNQLAEGNKEADYKNFLLSELQEINLDETDFEDLQTKLSTQENAGIISENLASIFARFDAEEIGVLDAVLDSKSKLSRVADLSHEFSELKQRFEENFVELKDILFELQNKAEQIEVNPELLEVLNSKINKLNALFLKHNVTTVPELIEIREKFSGEQRGFAELENYIAESEKELAATYENLENLAAKLSENRKKSAPVFTKKIEELLKQLGLEKAKFEVQLDESKDFNLFGKENISILFQANSGFPLKPIQTAISGGERSRVMLAVKKIMAENAELPTLILDEIDTGVSGKVADEMGKVMQEMSRDMQLIVITHLAQVAAKGNNNYKVVKKEISGRTQSTIISLNSEEKLQEIAQLLSGSKITEAALKQAEELMK
ncbi:Recombination protein N [Chryseobacterium taklimakanense]|uniref:DNA repair protein RecN n=1 Tax=Chryseobacterium taklimakanense TaxID=536441 RepID=A0A239XEZ2_9FLAO|nr:DNA repair protein RecN [Chryseobacterium taklimakanense]SNV44956.1 Recombination protein N [Chryseobacterium taklimakanense]